MGRVVHIPRKLGGSGGGLSLNGSIEFNGSDETLGIIPFSSSSPNQKTFTISFWFNADSFAGAPCFLSFFGADPFSDSTYVFVTPSSPDDAIFFISVTATDSEHEEYEEESVSTGSWTHVVIRVDTTLSTAADRVRIYLDGTELSSPTEFVTFDQNEDSNMFDGGVSVGSVFGGFAGFLNGHMADIIVVEGQALPPTDFGYDNGGAWSWKDYTGTFGAHGFRINPQDSSEIGTDQSGNGYDFTLNNMDASNFDTGDLPPS